MPTHLHDTIDDKGNIAEIMTLAHPPHRGNGDHRGRFGKPDTAYLEERKAQRGHERIFNLGSFTPHHLKKNVMP